MLLLWGRMRFQFFFEVFARFASLGSHERFRLMRYSMVARLGDLFLGPESPLQTAERRKLLSMGNR